MNNIAGRASVFVFLLVFSLFSAVGKIDAVCDDSACGNIANRCKQLNCVLNQLGNFRKDLTSRGMDNQTFDLMEFEHDWEPMMRYDFKDSNCTLIGIVDVTDSPAGNTDRSCVTKLKSKTPCMQESVKRHEAQHEATCRSVYKAKPWCANVFGYAGCETWAEYVQDEQTAYGIELSFLKSEMSALKAKKQCTCVQCEPPYYLYGKTGCAPAPASKGPAELIRKMVDYFASPLKDDSRPAGK